MVCFNCEMHNSLNVWRIKQNAKNIRKWPHYRRTELHDKMLKWKFLYCARAPHYALLCLYELFFFLSFLRFEQSAALWSSKYTFTFCVLFGFVLWVCEFVHKMIHNRIISETECKSMHRHSNKLEIVCVRVLEFGLVYERERIQLSAHLFRLDIMDFCAVTTISYSVVDLRIVILMLMRSPSIWS